MNNVKIFFAALAVMCLCGIGEVQAQHTAGIYGGVGGGLIRPFPKYETKPVMPLTNVGLSWRYYPATPRNWGGVGADLEYMQRGFTVQYDFISKTNEEGIVYREYAFYTRKFNTIMLPIVWEPHFYMFRNHLRLYIDLAVTFSYNFGGDYEREAFEEKNLPAMHGKYNWRIERDNRWNYGLAGGPGFALLFGRMEFGVRARYYFGYADILRNYNKYSNRINENSGRFDGPENPFPYNPIRSPIDNLNINITLAYRFNKDGFDEWYNKPIKYRQVKKKEFNFSEAGGGNGNVRGARRRR